MSTTPLEANLRLLRRLRRGGADHESPGKPPTFQESARMYLEDAQLRRNLGHATATIRGKRAIVVEEMPDWEQLREAGRALKQRVLRHLDDYLIELEASVERAGGHVHWARDAAEANRIIAGIVRRHGATEVAKVKSITSDEIKLNEALAAEGIEAVETDLAELIIQLDGDESSHFLVPAIHRNRAEIREIFLRKLPGVSELSDEPADLAEAARLYLRQKFLSARVGLSGANFAVAETGTVAVVESEGNGRMCLTLPPVLVTLMGIEKLVPTWEDLEVFLQLLPRSSTGERMNPYTSLWTGTTEGDGPREFHIVLLDNGRTHVLRDEIGRQALQCIRCSACLNVCPVYSRTGGHAYHSVYPGPIGSILTPQLQGVDKAGSLPYASTLCGACYEVCPVMINIPEVLVHMRGRVVRHKQEQGKRLDPEQLALQAMSRTFATRGSYERAQRLARYAQAPFVRDGRIQGVPGLGAWTAMRDLPAVPPQSFREWWRARPPSGSAGGDGR
jgi:L-lactate dehydrogenase complex protein LldF